VADKTQTKVEPEWLGTLFKVEYEKNNNFAGAMAALEMLLQRYPSSDYWRAALNVVEDRNKLGDEDRLQLFRLKTKMVKMQPEEYSEVARLAIRLGFPGEAKTALEKAQAEGVLNQGKNGADRVALLEQARAAAQKDKSTLPAQAKEIAAANKGSAYL